MFNIAQIDGYEVPVPVEKTPVEQHAEAEAIIAETCARIGYGGDRACYIDTLDVVQLPEREAFENMPSFYATAFHELGHWTGHKTRLDRDMKGRFGTEAYAAEELVAELCSAFLCANVGIRGELRHAGYIDSWIQLLKGDDRAIFTASSKAQQAADFINLQKPDVQEFGESNLWTKAFSAIP